MYPLNLPSPMHWEGLRLMISHISEGILKKGSVWFERVGFFDLPRKLSGPISIIGKEMPKN